MNTFRSKLTFISKFRDVRLNDVHALSSSLCTLGCTLGFVTTGLFTATMAQAEFLPTPPDQGAPDGRQRGGATRGDCLAYQDLTAVVPQIDGVVWSQTVSSQPNFYFHLPVALTAAVPLEFVVQDSRDNYVFRKQFSLETEPGTIFVPTEIVPAEVVPAETNAEVVEAVEDNPELAIGETYSWTFSIYCDAARPSASVSVSGTVQRVADTVLDGPLTDVSQAELARQYAETGVWHEAVEGAIGLVYMRPFNSDNQALLSSLLTQAGLGDLELGPLQPFDPILTD